MTIKKFDGRGGVVKVSGDRVELDNGRTIEAQSLQASPEQRYVGKWSPGKNHPALPPDQDGPYAGIKKYLPIPESQIVR